MTREQSAKLLQAYRAAIAARQDGIADSLEDVILELMGGTGYITSPVHIRESRTMTGPPWEVTCGPDVTPLGGGMTVTTDHPSKETTV